MTARCGCGLASSVAAAVAIAGLATDACAIEGDYRAEMSFEELAYVDDEHSKDGFETLFEANLIGSRYFGERLSARGEVAVVADDSGYTDDAWSFRNAQRGRSAFSLVEAVVDYRPYEGLRLSAGKQLVQWSGIDSLQPTDLMRSRDESDVFRQRDLGLYALATHYEVESVYMDLVVVPMAFPLSILPQGRWDIIDDEGGKVVREIDVPPVRFEETQVGMRLGWFGAGLDAALVGYIGRDSMPAFVPTIEFVGGVDRFQVTVTDKYPVLRSGGLVASYALMDAILLRYEGLYLASPEVYRDNFVHNIVGAELTRGDWRLVLNYMRDDTTSEAREETTDDGERRFFQSFVFGEVRYDGFSRVKVRLRGGYDIEERFLLLQPEITTRIRDAVQFVVAADIVDGREFGYFERIRHEDRVGIRLECFL